MVSNSVFSRSQTDTLRMRPRVLANLIFLLSLPHCAWVGVGLRLGSGLVKRLVLVSGKVLGLGLRHAEYVASRCD